MEKEVLTSHDVANLCSVSRKTVNNWVEDGSLKSYRTKGGHRRIKRHDLLDFSNEYEIPISFKVKILIVDDDTSISSALKTMFEEKDFIAEASNEGFAAGLLFESLRPDVVILDLFMRGVDGFSVCRRIREIDKKCRTKIVVLTGYPSDENFTKAKEAGADICLAKPVDNRVLLKTIQEIK